MKDSLVSSALKEIAILVTVWHSGQSLQQSEDHSEHNTSSARYTESENHDEVDQCRLTDQYYELIGQMSNENLAHLNTWLKFAISTWKNVQVCLAFTSNQTAIEKSLLAFVNENSGSQRNSDEVHDSVMAAGNILRKLHLAIRRSLRQYDSGSHEIRKRAVFASVDRI